MATFTNVVPVLNTTTGRIQTTLTGDTVSQTGTFEFTGTLQTSVEALASFNGIDHTTRLVLNEDFAQRPMLVGALATAPANKEFILLGTNAVSANSTFSAGGGVQLLTTAGIGDQMIVRSHTTAQQSLFNATEWNTNNEVVFKSIIRSPASLVDVEFGAGLKITPQNLTNNTDADQIWIAFDSSGTIGGVLPAADLIVVHSATAVHTQYDTGVAVATSTGYRIVLSVQSNRTVLVYINGALMATTAALSAGITTMKPFTSIQVLGAAARSMVLRRMTCSKLYA
jgi:hypothetical protein